MIKKSTQNTSHCGRIIWVVLLVLASLCGSLMLSCIAPFAALAVALAGTVRLRIAMIAMTATWLGNQFVGFVFYHLPRTWNTALWAVAIGGGALLTTLVSANCLRRMASLPAVARLGIALMVSCSVYEISLFAATLVLGGAETFSPAIIEQIALINATWLIALVVLNELMSALCTPWFGATPRLIKANV